MGPLLITHNLLALGAVLCHGGRALVSLPWWHLAVILCPRCLCLQCPFSWSGGTWSPSGTLATFCLGRGCSPPAARPGDAGVPLLRCPGPELCPRGSVLWHVVGTARLE